LSEKTTEDLIVEKGKTAPRVTPVDIETEIASEHYFTAMDGVDGAWLNSDSETDPETGEDIDFSFPTPVEPLKLLTFCVLVLQNGFTVHGVSACASPENFDEEIGQKVARQNAVNQIWPLLGFRLRDQLSK
jgi:hypothetical protein